MSDYYLPEEVIVEILYKLPVKSVVKCTILNKSWYSLIKSSNFISTHLRKTINLSNKLFLVLFKRNNPEEHHFSVRFDSNEFQEYLPLHFPPTTFRRFKTIGCCNGLVCLYVLISYDIILWNPSLGKTLLLPKPSSCFPNTQKHHHVFGFGFGFDSTSNDFKVLHLILTHMDIDSRLIGAEIYSLNTGSWKNITHIAPPYCSIMPRVAEAFVNGALHWIANDSRKNVPSSYIVAFDLRDEVFREIMLPKCYVNLVSYKLSILPFGESSIAVACTDPHELHFCVYDIWVMKEYNRVGSWMELWRVDDFIGCTIVFGLRNNGELMMNFNFEEIISLDIHSNRVKILMDQVNATIAFGYVETLALLDKGANEDDAIEMFNSNSTR